MAWHLNRALTAWRHAVNEAYPNRDKASDGTIGDEAHQTTRSDHNPDTDGSVDAWDMDVDLRSGDDPAAIEHLKRVFQAHPAARYWIHNGQIASRSTGWRRERYTGSNRHDKHVHWNSNEATEDSTAPWLIKPGGVSEMFCKRGDSGENVIALQTELNALGAGLTVDGNYGDATTDAVRRLIGGDGAEYRGVHFGRMQIALAKRYAGQAAPPASSVTAGEVMGQIGAVLVNAAKANPA